MEQESINGFLRRVRKSNGLTQKELAAKMGVTQATYSQWESSNRRPMDTTLERFAHALGYTSFGDLEDKYGKSTTAEEANAEIGETELGTLSIESCPNYFGLINRVLAQLSDESLAKILDYSSDMYVKEAEAKSEWVAEHIRDLLEPQKGEQLQETIAWVNKYRAFMKEAAKRQEKYQKTLQTQLDAQKSEESPDGQDTD